MKDTDRYHTPPELVAKMIACVPDDRYDVIADFSVGDGKLLAAAAEKWPSSVLVGTDVDGRAVSRLRRRYPAWIVGRCDFLHSESRGRSEVLREFPNCFSLVLLNPPFSGKGGIRWKCQLDDKTFQCSQALAFALTSLSFLDAEGHLVAILPTSCLKSDKDRAAWHYLSSHYAVRTVAENGGRSFNGCVAKTVIVHIKHKAATHLNGHINGTAIESLPVLNKSIVRTAIFRGKVQVHQAKLFGGSKGFPFIHSTEVKAEGIDLKAKRIRGARHFLKGPAVLLPRVGKPTVSKIAVYGSRSRIVLSDCVLAVRCASLKDARIVRETLRENWDIVAGAYSATCAPYVTVSALAEVLQHLGFQVAISQSDSQKREPKD